MRMLLSSHSAEMNGLEIGGGSCMKSIIHVWQEFFLFFFYLFLFYCVLFLFVTYHFLVIHLHVIVETNI